MKVIKIVSNFLDSNVFVCHDKKNTFIIDCGADVEKVLEAIKGKVSAIFLTHGHYDHAKNAVEYAKVFNCKIYANKNIQELLSDPAKNYGENFVVQDFSNFIFLNDDGSITINGEKIKYYYCPGHSKCCTCFLINNLLFTGDVLFSQGIGRTDLYSGSKLQMLESLKKLQTVPFEHTYSGHGDDSTKENQDKNIKVFIKFLSR